MLAQDLSIGQAPYSHDEVQSSHFESMGEMLLLLRFGDGIQGF